MALLTLLALAILVLLLNESAYLREYKATRLPQLGTLVMFLALPLVIVNQQTTSWLQLTWLLALFTGSLSCFMDWEHHLLPDRLLFPTFFISILLIVKDGGIRPALFGSFFWFAGFAVLAMVNPTGLGWGDVKFAALLGADTGAISLHLVPIAIFLALVFGGTYALFLIAKGDRRAQIPFGPFMFAGALAALMAAR